MSPSLSETVSIEGLSIRLPVVGTGGGGTATVAEKSEAASVSRVHTLRMIWYIVMLVTDAGTVNLLEAAVHWTAGETVPSDTYATAPPVLRYSATSSVGTSDRYWSENSYSVPGTAGTCPNVHLASPPDRLVIRTFTARFPSCAPVSVYVNTAVLFHHFSFDQPDGIDGSLASAISTEGFFTRLSPVPADAEDATGNVMRNTATVPIAQKAHPAKCRFTVLCIISKIME
jgi:hypothetical protein